MILSAYIDTSALLAVVFRQQESKRVFKALSSAKEVLSSDLIISESYSACSRENVDFEKARAWLHRLSIIRADVEESVVESILEIDHLRGADLHHLVSAVWMFGGSRKAVLFASLDGKQSEVARKLGFAVL